MVQQVLSFQEFNDGVEVICDFIQHHAFAFIQGLLDGLVVGGGHEGEAVFLKGELFLKGAGFDELWPHAAALASIAAPLFLASWLLFKRQW